MSRFLLLLTTVLSLALGLRPGRAGERPGGTRLETFLKQLRYEPVPFEYQRNQPVIKAELAGKTRLFLLDTGWGLTALKPRVAAGLKTLGELGVVLDDSLLGPLTNSSIVLIEKLSLGQAQFLNQPARSEELRMDYVGTLFDGVLGGDFLFRNFCLIDCGGRRLYVRSGEPSKEESRALEESLGRSGFSEVALKQAPLFTVEAQVNSQAIRLLVDTGAASSLLDESRLKELGLATIQEQRTGSLIPQDLSGLSVGAGKIGAHKLRVTKLDSLQLGARTWKGAYVGVTDLKAWQLGEQGSLTHGTKGLLGSDLLATHGALIDFAGKKLWFPSEKRNGTK